MKVVILDDSESSRELVQRMLGGAGHQVVPCDSPFSLTGVLLNERPDVLLVDVDMPALRGDKVVETVRRHEIHPCVIILYSGRPHTELAVLAHRSGASGYIGKDVAPIELNRRVTELVAKVRGCAS